MADLQHATDSYGGQKNVIPYKSQSQVAKQLEIMQKKINEHMDLSKEQEKDSWTNCNNANDHVIYNL